MQESAGGERVIFLGGFKRGNLVKILVWQEFTFLNIKGSKLAMQESAQSCNLAGHCQS